MTGRPDSFFNEGIDSTEFSVRYSSFGQAVDSVRGLGSGCFMAKVDIKHAFKLCPVEPRAWCLLGYM